MFDVAERAVRRQVQQDDTVGRKFLEAGGQEHVQLTEGRLVQQVLVRVHSRQSGRTSISCSLNGNRFAVLVHVVRIRHPVRGRTVRMVHRVLLWFAFQRLQHPKHVQRQLTELDLDIEIEIDIV